MPTLTTKEVHSLSEYMQFVEQQTDIRWYRGCSDASYELIPTLYRHPQLSDARSLFKKEFEILKRFKQRSIPYIGSSLKENDDLSILFIMQHFGVPTRLLDWTENPYIALYFALTNAKYIKSSSGPDYQSDVAIWVLDPVLWNGKALDVDPPPGIISPPHEDLLNGYLPSENVTYLKPEPVALYGVYNSPRIVAQRGVFALFGANIKPLERSYEDNNYQQDCLLKLLIKKENINNLLEALTRIGITDSVVYPDLSGLAKELKRHFGYWV
jgi:hypothetical protein